jgi:prolyl-tRNA synthetase
MLLSHYCLPILKEAPREAEILSHQLMVRAGMISQQSAGIYAWLPLGKKVLDKVCDIIRQEQNRAGALELLMPTLQSADLWRESGRYDSYGKEMLRIVDRHERDLLYGPTNEEMITDIFRRYIRSYKNLPMNLYHIQWKFRDEIRPRFGTMRSREFLMKDAYSFDLDEASCRQSYYRMFMAYLRTFARMGLKAVPTVADTGPIGGSLSHEFIILADTGESAIYCDKRLLDKPVPAEDLDFHSDLSAMFEDYTHYYAATDEEHDAALYDDKVPQEHQIMARGIEVGHIFTFGTKYSKAMNASVTGPDGQDHLVHMGSYGIGPTRLVPAIIEAHHDENGIIWPKEVAPFDVGLISMQPGHSEVDQMCSGLYDRLKKAGLDVLYDETDQRAGSKFATMDLIGLPWQVIVGPRGLKEGMIELKERATGERHQLSPDDLVQQLVHELSGPHN